MALSKKGLSVILTLLLAAGLALPAAAQRTIGTPEEVLVLPEASWLPGFLHRDIRQAIGIILRNTLSQFQTGDADTDEIDRLFASLPLLREDDELPGKERFRTLGMFLVKWIWPGIRGLRLVLMETEDPGVYWLGAVYNDRQGNQYYVFDLPRPIEYHRDTGVFRATQENGIFGIGFDYDAYQHMVFSSRNPFLGRFGYNKFYDAAAPLLGVMLDTFRIPFHYEGTDYMLQAWKGSYFGSFNGAEVGLYQKPPERFIAHYDPAELVLPMEFSLHVDGDALFSTGLWPRWWLAAFQYGPKRTIASASELRLEYSAVLEDEGLLAALLSALERYRPEGMTFEVDGPRLKIMW